MRTILAAGMIALLVQLGGVAHSEDAKTAAGRLLQEGHRAFESGRYDKALERYDRANRVFPSPKIDYVRGLALARLGRDLEALEALERFLAGVRDAPRDHRATAKKERAGLLKRVGTLIIAVNIEGATISIDGKPVGTAPLKRVLRVEPRLLHLTVTAPGHQDFGVGVDMDAGETERLDVELVSQGQEFPTVPIPETPPEAEPEPPAPTPAQPPVRTTRRVRSPWYTDVLGDVLTGAGLVGLGVGTYFFLDSRSAESSADDAATEQEFVDAMDEAESKRTISVIALSAGGALLVGGVIRYLTRQSSREVTVAAWGGPDGATVWASRSF